jgi:hypothetical protein
LTLAYICVANGAAIDSKKEQAQVVTYKYNQLPNNGYHFAYELSDGQIRDEFATFDDGILRIKGIYSYIGDDGKNYVVQYTADENGNKVKEFIKH